MERFLGSFVDNFFDNLVWETVLIILAILLTVSGVIVYKLFGWHNPKELIKGIRKAKKTSIYLLNNNRRGKSGYGWPSHLADRFIDIWCTNNKDTLNYGGINDRYSKSTAKDTTSLRSVDDILKKLGLIEIDNNHVKPIRQWPNDLIYKKCRKYLIKYHGDKITDYENMERSIKLLCKK